MAQQAQPISDLDNTGSWTSTPLWSKINEGGGGDGTVIVSDTTPVVTEPFTVDLSTITDPAKSTGHDLKIRWAKNAGGGGNKTIRIELREGYVNESTLGTLIATDDYAINSTTLRTDSTTMSGAEADAITDYSDLQIRVMGVAGNRALKVDFVELEIIDETDHNQRAFRIRSTDPAINANAGGDWDQLENVDATIDLDTLFRIRFEVEETASVSDGGVTYKLQYRVNTGGGYGSWTDLVAKGEPWPPLAQGNYLVANIVDASFADDAATTNILTTSSSSFVAGVGMHDNLSTSITLNNQHTELEWALVIARYYDSLGVGDDGDLFQFRVVESDGTLFTGDTNSGYDNIPEITANLAIGHIGGTHIEQPGKLGPVWDGNGNQYTLTEHTNTTPNILLHKSIDGGDTWAQATVTGRPTESDPEGLGIFHDPVNDPHRLHIITRAGDDLVLYHRYHMSSHATTPDTWNVIDRTIDADAGQPAGGVASESCDITIRTSDGFIFVAYNGNDATNDVGWINHSDDDGVTFETREVIDSTGGRDYTGVGITTTPNSDDVFVFVLDNTGADIYFDRIDSAGVVLSDGLTVVATDAGTLGQVADNIIRPVSYDDGGVDVVMVAWQASAGEDISTRTLRDGTLQTTATGASDNATERSFGTSHQPVADIAVDGTTVWLMYGENATIDIFYDDNPDEAGWGTDTEEQDAVTCHYIHAGVGTHSSGNGGDTVLGYIWNQGDDGLASGFNRYDEVVLVVGGTTVYPPFPRQQRRLVRM